jgi:hypothetical protein
VTTRRRKSALMLLINKYKCERVSSPGVSLSGARGSVSIKSALAPLSSPLGQQPQGSQYALGRAAARAAGRASERQAAASLVHSL